MERYAACAFYTERKEVMLQFRSADQSKPYSWAFFGGKMKNGENVEGALLREIKEELDIDLTNHQHCATFITESGNEIDLFVAPLSMPMSAITIFEGNGFVFASIDFALKEFELPDTTRRGLEHIQRYFESHGS